MGGEETQEGPYYNSDTLDDGRIIAPGYVNCLICICMNKTKNYFTLLVIEYYYYIGFLKNY